MMISGGLFLAQGYFWEKLIAGGFSIQPADYALPVSLTVAFAVMFSLTAVLSTAKWLGWVIFGGVSFAAVLLEPLWIGTYMAGGLAGASLMYALYTARRSYSNMINFNSAQVIKSCLSGTFTAIALLMSFYDLNIQLIKPSSIVPEGLIEQIVSFAGGMVEKQTQGEIGGSVTDDLTKQATGMIQTQIDKFIEPYKPFMPYAFAILFFASARGLMSMLGWLVVPLCSVILKFFVAIGLVRREKVQIEAERIFF